MVYQPKDFSYLIGMPGFSEQLLKNHFTLYQGYVTNTNKLIELLESFAKEGKTGTPEFAEIKRRLGWEWNGMRLHEYYFENLGGNGQISEESKIYRTIEQTFGSFENWVKEFKGTGLMRGIGWVILYQDLLTGKLINVWINEHDVGHLSGGNPILVMDVFEHAFMLDYGLKRAEYIEAFFNNLNWKVVEERLK